LAEGTTDTGLAARQLFAPGPKRILALDGGGTKGIIELAFLGQIEVLLRQHHGDDPGFRLSDWFHLIGGTSTGAIIAAGLTMGKTVGEITELYLELGPIVFRPRSWRLPGLAARFDAKPLQRLLQGQFGDRALDSADLRTGLAVIAHRFDTGSPWLISNNPRAPFWQDPPSGAYRGNRHYLLREVVRASTAAPGYFRPQEIAVLDGSQPALFVDGGLSPHNNPALSLLMMTQVNAFHLNWPTGPQSLHITSIGAGYYRRGLPPGAKPPSTAGGMAFQCLMQSLSSAQAHTLTMLQWLGESPSPWQINSEIGDLAGDSLGGAPLFGFQRYDLLLEAAWLRAELGVTIPERHLNRLRRLDQPALMRELLDLASTAAAKQVRLANLSADTNRPSP
jgi:predicted acylesterase/phospholipase RssA